MTAGNETGELADWLGAQRWFAGRDPEISAAPHTEVADGLVVTLAATRSGRRAGADDGEVNYQLVGERPCTDSLGAPTTTAALARAFREETEATGAAGTVRFAWEAGTPAPTGEGRPLGAEQSNTSLVLDEAYVVKVLRRLQPGESLELEVLRHLHRSGFAHVPDLVGWCTVDGGPLDATLAVATRLVPDAADGWDHVLATLADGRGDTLLPGLHELGVVLAGLHRALADPDGDAEFRPVEGGKPLASGLAEAIGREAGAALAGLIDHPAVAADPVVARLSGRAGDVARVAHELAERLDAGPAIRHHGDLHLGQVLLGRQGWVIIDFEGEPARRVEARRAPHSPLRDVAGLLRSIGYAAGSHPGGEPLAGWEAAARAALLDGYLTAADPVLLPPGPVPIARTLALLELEKAVYEIGYELAHRPEWVPIPARALDRLLGGHQ